MSDTTPLLWQHNRDRSPSQERLPYYRDEAQNDVLNHKDVSGNNPHMQFCALVGCPPSDWKGKEKWQVPKKSLYGRTVNQLSSQRRAYGFSASLNNVLLLSQVILGAALTALGASASSHILITIFGATNTVIAGLVAYLKSRGQPMRARMYRDDLERIVDDIENSEIMWRGISEGAHGYDEIDTDEVTVRSEVARLTRLYERAIRLNGMNNPDMYMAGASGFDGNTRSGMRSNRPNPAVPADTQTAPLTAVAPPAPQPSGENPGAAVPVVPEPEDAAPATKADLGTNDSADKPKDGAGENSKADGKKVVVDSSSGKPNEAGESSSTSAGPVTSNSGTAASVPVAEVQPQPQASTSTAAEDPDASPATAVRLKSKRTRSGQQRDDGTDTKKVAGDDDD